MNTKETFKGIKKERIDEWKASKSKIYAGVIEVAIDPDDLSDDAEMASFHCAKPSRNVMYAAAASAEKGNLKKCNDILIKNCILGGDMEHLEDDEIYMAVLEQIGELRQKRTARLKKS